MSCNYLLFLLCFAALRAAATQLSSSASAQTQATGSLSSGILTQVHALTPTCTSTLVPYSSSCHPGVHTLTTKGKLGDRAVETEFPEDAITAECTTFYSTSSTCRIGVHTLPPFPKTTIKVTETSVITSAKTTRTSTVTTTKAAEILVSAPKLAVDLGNGIGVFIKPELQGQITQLANSFCPGKLKKRSTGLSCQLPQSARVPLEKALEKLFDTSMEIGGYLQKKPGVVKKVVAGYVALEIISLGFVSDSYKISLDSFKSFETGGKASVITSTTTTSSHVAPTYTPGPPNWSSSAPASSDIALLTKYLDRYFASSFNGKVTITKTPTTTSSAGTPTHTYPSNASCLNGTYFQNWAWTDAISSFCSSASSIGLSAGPTGTNTAWHNGEFAREYTNVPAIPTNRALYAKVKYVKEACPNGGSSLADFHDSGWCFANFANAGRPCALVGHKTVLGTPVPTSWGSYALGGGVIYRSCIEWSFRGIDKISK